MSKGYRLIHDAALDARNTFGVAAQAPLLVEVTDASALPDAFADAIPRDAPVLALGGGSNVLFAGNPEGVVLALTGQRISVIEDDGDIATVRVEAGAGWHALVMWSLEHGLAGLENLALIPGTVGAAPIQNIGAYGAEVRDRIHAVEAYERATGALRRMRVEDCGFAYRDSVFKREPDRFVVTAVEFALPRNVPLLLDYAGIRDELSAMGIANPSRAEVAQAVCRIRRRKLPDPAVIGNAGSFFKNPIVPADRAAALKAAHASLPVFVGGDESTRKLSAAWLIEQCGWKGHRDGDAGVAASHALVLVNHGRATGAELLALARRIADSVRERYGVELEPEPRVIGATW